MVAELNAKFHHVEERQWLGLKSETSFHGAVGVGW